MTCEGKGLTSAVGWAHNAIINSEIIVTVSMTREMPMGGIAFRG